MHSPHCLQNDWKHYSIHPISLPSVEALWVLTAKSLGSKWLAPTLWEAPPPPSLPPEHSQDQAKWHSLPLTLLLLSRKHYSSCLVTLSEYPLYWYSTYSGYIYLYNTIALTITLILWLIILLWSLLSYLATGLCYYLPTIALLHAICAIICDIT